MKVEIKDIKRFDNGITFVVFVDGVKKGYGDYEDDSIGGSAWNDVSDAVSEAMINAATSDEVVFSDASEVTMICCDVCGGNDDVLDGICAGCQS